MEKEKIIQLIELIIMKKRLEDNDKEKDDILKSNPYAINEGYESDKMKRVEEIEKEIEKIN